MLVKTLVRSITRSGSIDKPFATLCIETDSPLEIIEIRLFKNSIDDGTVTRLESCINKVIDLPLNASIYQGRLQYQIPFDTLIQVPSSNSTKKSGAL